MKSAGCSYVVSGVATLEFSSTVNPRSDDVSSVTHSAVVVDSITGSAISVFEMMDSIESSSCRVDFSVTHSSAIIGVSISSVSPSILSAFAICVSIDVDSSTGFTGAVIASILASESSPKRLPRSVISGVF